MIRIVRTTYHYRRPPRRKKPVALEVPAVVTAKKPPPSIGEKAAAEIMGHAPASGRSGAAQPSSARKAERVAPAAIVTIQRQSARIIPPDLLPETPEEHRRRGDAADGLWRELVRRVAVKP
jgi:hypothetical protein